MSKDVIASMSENACETRTQSNNIKLKTNKCLVCEGYMK